MRNNRLQNKVAGSVFTLPVCAVVALLSWVLPWYLPDVFPACSAEGLPWNEGWGDALVGRLVAIGLVTLATCVLVEMNNRNLLLRIRSRMVSSVWLFAVASIPLVHIYSKDLAAACCILLAYFLLFSTYQKRKCQFSTFHYALMIGLGSIFQPYVIACLPLFLWHQTVFLRSMSLRAFCAALLGVLFPAVLWVGYSLVVGDISGPLSWVNTISSYEWLSLENYLALSIQQVASWGLVSFLGIIGVFHYLSTSYNDRIQVRMLLYILVIQFVVLQVFVGLQPQHLDSMMPILMVTSAPLIAHFFALTGSWFTNALFVLSVLAFLGLAYFNMCMPTLYF